jgi:hypothetical protein
MGYRSGPVHSLIFVNDVADRMLRALPIGYLRPTAPASSTSVGCEILEQNPTEPSLAAMVALLDVWRMVSLKIFDVAHFSGMCDASAGVLVDDQHLVVANDEENFLHVYDIQSGGKPLDRFRLELFLGLEDDEESDLEGAASLDGVTFWISSHGRTKKGKESPSRQVFFATKLGSAKGGAQIQTVGRAYRKLLSDLVAEPKLSQFKLADAAKLPPKEKGGLNIEGLAATPDGHLLIGFRNPIPKGKALLVPLLNPHELIDGKRARFGDPVLIDLGGLGIRDIVWFGSRYLLLAGPYDSRDTSHLFEWDGKSQAKLLTDLPTNHGNPEALIPEPSSASRIHVLTDNGSKRIDGKECKDVKEPSKRYFQKFSIDLK